MLAKHSGTWKNVKAIRAKRNGEWKIIGHSFICNTRIGGNTATHVYPPNWARIMYAESTGSLPNSFWGTLALNGSARIMALYLVQGMHSITVTGYTSSANEGIYVGVGMDSISQTTSDCEASIEFLGSASNGNGWATTKYTYILGTNLSYGGRGWWATTGTVTQAHKFTFNVKRTGLYYIQYSRQTTG